MKAPGFSKMPQASKAAHQGYQGGAPPRSANGGNQQRSGGNRTGGAMVPANRGAPPQSRASQVSLLSNQYRLTLGQNACVYQYVLDIKPDEFWEAHRVHEIIKSKKTSLEKALGFYVVSGKTIYTLTELEESLMFKTVLRGE